MSRFFPVFLKVPKSTAAQRRALLRLNPNELPRRQIGRRLGAESAAWNENRIAEVWDRGTKWAALCNCIQDNGQ